MKLLIPLAVLGFAVIKGNPLPKPENDLWSIDENEELCEEDVVEEMDLPEVKAAGLESDLEYASYEQPEDCLDDGPVEPDAFIDVVLPAESEEDAIFDFAAPALKSSGLDAEYEEACEDEEPIEEEYEEELPFLKSAGGLGDMAYVEPDAEYAPDCEADEDAEDADDLDFEMPALKSAGLAPLTDIGAAFTDLDDVMPLDSANGADGLENEECEEY